VRACPRCGYVELDYWRQNNWRTNVEWTWLHEFEIQKPTLAEQLKQGIQAVTDPCYGYRLGGKGKNIVERVILAEFKVSGLQAFHIPREKHKARALGQARCQTKLLETK